jgi:hypothetical protein
VQLGQVLIAIFLFLVVNIWITAIAASIRARHAGRSLRCVMGWHRWKKTPRLMFVSSAWCCVRCGLRLAAAPAKFERSHGRPETPCLSFRRIPDQPAVATPERAEFRPIPDIAGLSRMGAWHGR